MRKVLAFLMRYSIVALFLVLEAISFAIFVNNDRYPKSVFLSSSNGVVASLQAAANSVGDFLRLFPANKALSAENARLKDRITELENQIALAGLCDTDTSYFVYPDRNYTYIPAKIINSSTNKTRNFITLNRGKRDGIHPDMGVVSPEGVVGIVKTVSEHFSVAIPLLNPMIQINGKIARNNFRGPVSWDGLDYRYVTMNDVPRHVELYKGDSILTSGLTATFPENIPIGIIDNFVENVSGNFHNIKVKLAVDFRKISNVHIVSYKNFDEQVKLENAEN
ncbi:rod shape-determining protein MreC [Paludibacter sp. 221]|uniref:rod shape-determining protein MreC n=1 Tax=Paludibacter sp. 221 TaxID=2302939 RepID=UPI0013D41B33|nr:rod shape-determining protein MreC [Paludibacter sp. 221]NDV47192.1 rod shape-determining protein MreC [Paludibacter sp. 221]